MITYLVSNLTYGTNSPLADLAENILRSFPFMILIAYLDYLLVRYIYRTEWLCKHLIIRIIVEFTALSVLAVGVSFIGSLPFVQEMGFMTYLTYTLSWNRVLPVVIVNVFTITIIEVIIQNQQSKQRAAELEQLQTPIIFTTAYDKYAIRAFQVNGIGDLLKPIVEDDLVKAIDKFDAMPNNLKQLIEAIHLNKRYKSRISVKSGDKFTFVDMSNVAYFYAEEGVTFVVTNQTRKHIVDYTLDALEPILDPTLFFRITRGCIASINSIDSVSKYFNSRLKIKLTPVYECELLVSRVRVPIFLKWLDGE